MDLISLRAACYLVASCLLFTTLSSFFYPKSHQDLTLEYGAKRPVVAPFQRVSYAESPTDTAFSELAPEGAPLASSHTLQSDSSVTATPQKPLRTGADAVVVAFDSQGNEVLDVPDTSNSTLDQPYVTGDAAVVIFDSQGNEVLDVPDTSNSMLDQPYVTGGTAVVVGDVLDVHDDTNRLLLAPQITGVDAVETRYENGSVLEVQDWPLVYEVTVTGAPALEIYDPVTGDTVID